MKHTHLWMKFINIIVFLNIHSSFFFPLHEHDHICFFFFLILRLVILSNTWKYRTANIWITFNIEIESKPLSWQHFIVKETLKKKHITLQYIKYTWYTIWFEGTKWYLHLRILACHSERSSILVGVKSKTIPFLVKRNRWHLTVYISSIQFISMIV